MSSCSISNISPSLSGIFASIDSCLVLIFFWIAVLDNLEVVNGSFTRFFFGCIQIKVEYWWKIREGLISLKIFKWLVLIIAGIRQWVLNGGSFWLSSLSLPKLILLSRRQGPSVASCLGGTIFCQWLPPSYYSFLQMIYSVPVDQYYYVALIKVSAFKWMSMFEM